MSIRFTRVFAAIGLCCVSSFGLTACQSSCTGDPRFDNYWCARENLYGGTYARQTNQLRQTAANRQLEAAALRSRLEERQAALANARSSNASEARVRELQDEIANIRRQIVALSR